MDTLPPPANSGNLSSPGVYLITNTINQHKYVGSSVNIRRRWREHRSSLNRGTSTCTVLQRAWNLYGEDAFAYSVLEYVSARGELAAKEQYYINKMQPEYNAQPIVDRPGPRIYSAETRAKLSAASKGRKQTEEHKEHMRQIMTGRQFTPEWIEHLKEAQARRVITEEEKAAFQARMNDPEIAAKRNRAIKGKKRTPEQRQRFSEGQRKRLAKSSPEQRAAMITRLSTPEAIAKRRATYLQRKIRADEKKRNQQGILGQSSLWEGLDNV